MKLTRIAAAVTGVALTASLAACGSSTKSADKAAAGATTNNAGALVGVTMPTKDSERWIHDGDNVKAQLIAKGYKVDLEYANNDIPTQANQIETQISKGAKVLIIASIDGTALSTQLQEAHDKGIKVISYDRLLMKSPNVDYYASFDNFKVGVQQADSLLVGLGFQKEDGTAVTPAPTGPLNIELFAGSADDNNAPFFFKGAMSILQPLIDKGVLVVKSGQTDFNTVATPHWDGATAQKRMEDLITKSYTGGTKIAGVLSPYDGISRGILSALSSAGYGTGGQAWPIVTGQDAEVLSVKSIAAGEQYATVWKDTRKLADLAVTMTDDVLTGKPVTTNSTDYNNGDKVVPTEVLDFSTVYKDNYKSVLIDSGYYTADQLK